MRNAPVLAFAAFEVNVETRELRKHGIRIKLHAQPFDLLAMMLENQGEVVTRDQMRERLWGSGTFVDFDHGLNTAINKLREALDDSAASPRYIETIPGRGYRFIAPVTSQLPKQAKAVLAEPDELPVIPRKTARLFLLLIQLMYLSFYIGALANLAEIHEILADATLTRLTPALITSAAVLIPVRLYLALAVVFDFRGLPSRFARIFPVLLILDLAWALSPFLLIHHINAGVALSLAAPLFYVPFAQRSLVLMYGRAKA